ncbi:ABC transporter periplasmic protein [Oleiphilus messinensis]|uniref:ABC transporter periplasmic protein n=1 Tax=Oleiphilus messinensis TaxID=141451 RepID=A0A1Y0I6G8_9GAMM|nr:transporter substrate-binding domain-containing protein [Oleiphilus messinensis]ARU55820.1 ABC transporter periplasmic protein [Oleiphilus messinensis]
MLFHIVILFILCSIAIPLAATETTQLKIGFVDAGQPYNIKSGQLLVDGLNYEVIQLILKEAKLGSAKIIGLPKLRVAEFLKNGKIQMLCLYSPKWMKSPLEVLWGPIITTFDEHFIILKKRSGIENHSQLIGKTVGGHLGYRYSDRFRTLVQSGQIQRNNYTETNKLYELLFLKRLYAIIDNQFSFTAMLNHESEYNSLRASKLIDKSYPVTCALSRQRKSESLHLLNAMNELKHAGKFDSIIDKYNSLK